MRLSRAILVLMLFPLAAWAEPLIDGPSAQGPTFEAVEQAFRARVLDAFPEGTPLADMTARLTAEGFTIYDGYAGVEKQGFPCDIIWRVLWNEDNGFATDLDVVHDGICL